ncbi:TPA: hypothetical protein NGR28_004604 [Vibrio parahaemolyticus]|nr:hypothetical protein [Vibrio parahaemolyticus]
MSFNINFQKTNKTSIVPDRLVVRRFWYDKETKKQKSKTIFTASRYSAPIKLSDEIIAKHEVTKEEQQQYQDFMLKVTTESADASFAYELESITNKLERYTASLEQRSDGVTLSEIERFEEVYTTFKKQLSRHKRNAKKRGDEALAQERAKEQGQTDIVDSLKEQTFKLYKVSHEPHTSGSRFIAEIYADAETAKEKLYKHVEEAIKDAAERKVLGGLTYAYTHWDIKDESGAVVQSWEADAEIKKMGITR